MGCITSREERQPEPACACSPDNDDAASAEDAPTCWVKLEKGSIPISLIERSEVLKTTLEAEGEATLPITASAFRLWCKHRPGADETLEDACTLLKVFLSSHAVMNSRCSVCTFLLEHSRASAPSTSNRRRLRDASPYLQFHHACRWLLLSTLDSLPPRRWGEGKGRALQG